MLKDKSLGRMILENTSEKGVDIILTTQASEIFQGSLNFILKCVTDRGHFIELGTAEFLTLHHIYSSKNCSFHSVMPNKLLNASSQLKKRIHRLITKGICVSIL